MSTKKHPVAIAALTLLAGLFGATTSAQAVDWGGYFRTGPGATKKGTARGCYGLSGVPDGVRFRLGNECDFYGEFGLSQGMKSGGVDYKATLMTDLYNGGTDSGASKLGIVQMYAEGKGFDVAPEVNFWIGKRYHGRADVHIVDTHFINLSGVGAGADEIKLGSSAKLGVSYFRVDDSAGDTAGVASTIGNQPANRFNVDVSDIAVNPGGKLRAVGTFTQGTFDGGKTGLGLSLQHKQAVGFFGPSGTNTVWLQFAQGSAALDGRVGDGRLDSNSKSVRVIDSIDWQVGKFGGQALALWSQVKTVAPDTAAETETNIIGVGGRGSYAFTNNFKLVSEIGYSESKPKAGEAQKLAKFTLAPTLSTGPGFWNRPEFRLYVTTAKWNSAANAAAGAGGLNGTGDGKTTGTSYGAQLEMWF